MIDPDRLAVCSWSLQPSDCDDLIAKVGATGLNAVQLHLNPVADEEPGWHDTPARLADAGIEVVSGMVTCEGEDYSSIAAIERTGGVVPDATWPATRAAMGRAATLAGRVGLKLVTFHAGFVPHDADAARATLVERLNDAAAIFAAEGCGVALETGQESADALVDLLGDLDADVGVNFDPANMILYGSGEPVAALRRLLPRVRQVHLKDAVASDAPGREWGVEVPVGQGQVDWPGFFAALDEAGYAGPACVEREAGDDRVGDVQTTVDFVRGQL